MCGARCAFGGGLVWSRCAGEGSGRGGRVGWRERSSVVDILTVGCERRKIERSKRSGCCFGGRKSGCRGEVRWIDGVIWGGGRGTYLNRVVCALLRYRRMGNHVRARSARLSSAQLCSALLGSACLLSLISCILWVITLSASEAVIVASTSQLSVHAASPP